ncbi:hypothetical protein VTJ04DRAFT_2017 [Mycothermus thermophilus]|uniref:uncharacterized protein n=1 Tax=Humicola insolens TaxID=85995 RepID=UPI0037449F9A
MPDSCAACQKAPPEVTLSLCAKCHTTFYCSRKCQKSDWESHKKACKKIGRSTGAGNPSPSSTPPNNDGPKSPPKGLDQPISKPFTHLVGGTWLHERPEKDVYRLLIDAWRLRVADEENFGPGGTEPVGRGLNGFRRFLKLASEHQPSSLLPKWWNEEKENECVEFGTSGSEWQDLNKKIDKATIISHYGDDRFPMQLRMFAEFVFGRAPGGQDGSQMLLMMMATELPNGGPGGVFSLVDAQTGRVTRMG